MDPPFEQSKTIPQPPDEGEPEPVPAAVGPFKVEKLHRRGGMSALYLARHPTTEELIIVKVLLSKYLTHPDALSRFETEAKILGRASHPSIVKLIEQGSWEKGQYLALEYVSGESLRDWIQFHPMSLRRSLEIALEIAYALCHLHTLGAVHRDLKPENILMSSQGVPKLIDLGVGLLLTESSPKEQETRQIVGTPIYMSPEQRENSETVSYGSDIYSLGILTYEIVLGKLSHGHIYLSLLPRGLQKILAKALQKRPDERYQDVVDFIADLSSYLNSPSLEEERTTADQVRDLWEHLRHSQMALLPTQLPSWPHIQLGLACENGGIVGGIYYDFFELPEGRYAIVLAEPIAKGVEGLCQTAVLRGMIRTLTRFTSEPRALLSVLNELIATEGPRALFTLAYLLLDPQAKEWHFFGSGKSHLWVLPAGEQGAYKMRSDNPPLGLHPLTDFQEEKRPWSDGDLLLLHTAALLGGEGMSGPLTPQQLDAFLVEIRHLPPQKQTEELLRLAKPPPSHPLEHHAFGCIAIAKNSPQSEIFD